MAFSIDDYDIIDVLGSGGFGTVYRARQKSLDRLVAIKCLSVNQAQSQRDIIRFRREAEAMAALAHESVVSIFDYAYTGGSYYLVMEYVEGINMDEALTRKIPSTLSIFILEKIVLALACAHERGIIHRDIKGANILLGINGQVKLADFGLAVFRREAVAHQSAVCAMGTLAYMAPEVMVSPGQIDKRADIYSLGCILYQVFSGRPPFWGETLADISYQVLNRPVPPLSLMPPYAKLAPLIMQCLSKDREARPQLDTILAALRVALRAGPSVGPEEIASFVREKQLQTKGTAAQRPVLGRLVDSPASAAPKPTKKTRFAIVAAVAIGVAVCVGMLGIAGLRPSVFQGGRRKNVTMAPILQNIHRTASQAVADAALKAAPQQSPRTGDGPIPQTGEDSETKTSAVAIDGLTAYDTVFINGVVALLPDASQSRRRIYLPSGHWRLVVRGAAGRQFSREIELMPYQVVQWRLKQ